MANRKAKKGGTAGPDDMNDRWKAAALRGTTFGFVAVTLIVIVHALRHGWESVSQPGDWAEKAIIFLLFSVIYTVFFWNVDRRSRT